jgi:hypothetical protein
MWIEVKWLDCSFDSILLEEVVLKILVTYATSEGHTRKVIPR